MFLEEIVYNYFVSECLISCWQEKVEKIIVGYIYGPLFLYFHSEPLTQQFIISMALFKYLSVILE